MILDSKEALARTFGVQSIPANVVIGRNGKVVTAIAGADVRGLEQAVRKALGQK